MTTKPPTKDVPIERAVPRTPRKTQPKNTSSRNARTRQYHPDEHPIFFAWTRSFWAAVATFFLILESGEPVIRGFATLIEPVLVLIGMEVTVEGITDWLQTVGPVLTLMTVVHQRSGAARPYTIKITKETLS